MHTTTPFFTAEQLAAIDAHQRPAHIAIIPDGNRRWAQKREVGRLDGHRQGADGLMNIVQAAQELSIGMLTVYGFSTENWQRPPSEVEAVLWLIQNYLIDKYPMMVDNNIRFLSIGDREILPEGLQEILEEAENATAHCNGITLSLALNYSGRNELCRALQHMLADNAAGKIDAETLDEKSIESYLDTKGYPDPDLLIRPGGEQRLSNFLLWQLSYTELHFSPKMWPEFGPEDLYEAILAFQQRQRRLGA
jgi:undecaprenyl diphosphate synthase